MLTNILPACPFDINVNSVYSNFISINIKNITNNPLKIIMPLSFYRSDDDFEIDQFHWNQGLMNADRDDGLAIKAKTVKGGMAAFLSDIPEKGVWSLNVIVPADNIEYFINYRYDQCEPLHFSPISIEQKKFGRQDDSTLELSPGVEREITKHVERFDLIEGKFGISIENIYASVQAASENEFFVCVNFDILSGGDSLRQDFQIHATAYNKEGQAIGMEATFIRPVDFFGFDSKSIIFTVSQPVEKIRLFPKK